MLLGLYSPFLIVTLATDGSSALDSSLLVVPVVDVVSGAPCMEMCCWIVSSIFRIKEFLVLIII